VKICNDTIIGKTEKSEYNLALFKKTLLFGHSYIFGRRVENNFIVSGAQPFFIRIMKSGWIKICLKI